MCTKHVLQTSLPLYMGHHLYGLKQKRLLVPWIVMCSVLCSAI